MEPLYCKVTSRTLSHHSTQPLVLRADDCVDPSGTDEPQSFVWQCERLEGGGGASPL